MSVAGVLPGQFRQADDRITVDVDEASGLPDAAAFGEVVEDGTRFLVGEVGVEQRRPLALGEAGPAGVAVELSELLVLAESATD